MNIHSHILKNKKGSALLWCVLLIIILTILLGSVLTASYTYFNYTMRTIKRQQAYFTARSGVNLILHELTDEEAIMENGAHKTNEFGDYEYFIPIEPENVGDVVTINNFGFSPEMGVVTGSLKKIEEDKIEIEVTSYYPDELGEKYSMKATAVYQPLFFGGVAVKNLTLNGNLTLGDGTDFYWGSEDLFNPDGNGTSLINNGNYKMTVPGNLVTLRNATLTKGNSFAGETITTDTPMMFTKDAGKNKRIWSTSRYIISNKRLNINDDEMIEYTDPSGISKFENLTNYKLRVCNNEYSNTKFGYDSAGSAAADAFLSGISWYASFHYDMANAFGDVGYSTAEGLEIRYVRALSLKSAILNEYANNPINEDEEAGLLTRIGNDIRGSIREIVTQIANRVGNDCLDITSIDFASDNTFARLDKIVPLTYLFLDGGADQNSSVKARIRYGHEPDSKSGLGSFFEGIGNDIDDIMYNYFDIQNDPSYVVVYMQPNSVLELGYNKDGERDTRLGKPFNQSKERVFMYSIYGLEGTTVILWDGVIVLGEIICDNLILKGDAQVVFSSVTGSRVTKQQIAEYWAVSNYTD